MVVGVALIAMLAAASMAVGMVLLMPVFMILIVTVVPVRMTIAVSVATMVVGVRITHSSFL
jgi:hypothetical protein